MSAPSTCSWRSRLAAELEPTAHVRNGPAEYRIDVEAPGLGVDDFSVHLAGRLLRITGPSLSTPGADKDFEFLFRLPDQVAGGDLVASFEEGKLVVRAPSEASRGACPIEPSPWRPGLLPVTRPRAAARGLASAEAQRRLAGARARSPASSDEPLVREHRPGQRLHGLQPHPRRLRRAHARARRLA